MSKNRKKVFSIGLLAAAAAAYYLLMRALGRDIKGKGSVMLQVEKNLREVRPA